MLTQTWWVLQENWLLLIEVAVLVSGLGGLIFFGLRNPEPFRDRFSFAEALSAGICLSVILSFGVVILSHLWPGLFRYLVGLLLVTSAISTPALMIQLPPRIKRPAISKVGLFFFLVFLAVLVTRFPFLYHLNFPPYQDSPEHFQIIQDLRNPAASPLAQFTIGKLFTLHYYHFGFHSLVAVISAFGSIQDVLSAMLIVGQLMVVISPFTLAFFAKEFTGSSWAAVFTALFAGVGWRMPLYAVNWGKYPEIAGIAIFPLALAWLTVLVTRGRRKGSAWFMAGIGCIASLLLHSRMLILLLAALITFVLIKLLSRHLKGKLRVILIILIEIVLMVILILRSQDLTYAISIYVTGTDLIITCLAVLLSLWAVYQDPKRSLAVLTFFLMVFVFCLTPLPGSLENYLGSYTLLDRPLVELILFTPLAMGAGMGLAALGDLRRFMPGLQKTYWTYAGSLLFILLLVFPIYLHAQNGDYHPDACCDLMNNDDISTVGWITAHLPADARILISVQTIAGQIAATDGGIWITPLTGIRTVQFPRTTDFANGTTYASLCGEQIGYIFLGGTAGSFDPTGLERENAWYSRLLDLPMASLYRINCPIH